MYRLDPTLDPDFIQDMKENPWDPLIPELKAQILTLEIRLELALAKIKMYETVLELN